MRTSALFYPHVTIAAPRHAGQSQDYDKTDIRLLKTALLLWDDLQVIVPYGSFGLRPSIGENQEDDEKAIREGFELVVRPRVVTDAEKDVLYKELKKLIGKGVPETLKFNPRVDNYNMYPEKLDPRIWELLKEAELVKHTPNYFGLQRDFGLILMSLIADICAGGTREKVTNYHDAHEAYTRLIATQKGVNPDFDADTQRAYLTLTSISIKTVDTNKFSLANLVRLRKRESEDGLLPPLRRNYRNAIDKCINRLKNEAKSKSDVEQIEKDFEKQIQDDFAHLTAMLGLEAADVRTGVLATVLAAINPLNWPNVFGSASKAFPSYKLKKQAVLEKHVSAWLYAA